VLCASGEEAEEIEAKKEGLCIDAQAFAFDVFAPRACGLLAPRACGLR